MSSFNFLYSHLSIYPHNPHYLKRYIKFILSCLDKNVNLNSYLESHHILPKHKKKFPQFASFTDFPWNRATLTYRQHIIAHYILFKAYNTDEEALSIIKTVNQFHEKSDIKIKYLNSKSYSVVKQFLSDNRKGKLLRNPFTEEQKLEISIRQTLRYQDPENRKKHSIACKGKKKTITSKLKARHEKQKGVKQAEDVKLKIKETSNKNELKRKQNKQLKNSSKGLYITPFGVFSTSPFSGYCINNTKIITVHHVKSNKILTKETIGLTFEKLGFKFIPRDHPEFERFRVRLDLVHLPEPNHPLWSKLNDYLLQEKLLPQ